MIRLPPSVLILGPRDLVEYEEHRKQRDLENVKQQFARFDIGDGEGPRFVHSRRIHTSTEESVNGGTSQKLPKATARDHSLAGGDGYEEPRYSDLVGPPSSVDQSSVRSDAASAEMVSQVSLEGQQSSPLPKDGFHYGGFIDSRRLARSSPFAPEDVSTPPHFAYNQTGNQMRTLPRSPLYFSHNASSSPERRLTSSLTPRVVSRVANHNTPGIIFSQPARRPATFRHQTNSFSFDSTERSSTAYEQERVSSLSTTDTTPRPSQDLRLHDELRGSSLTSSRVSSAGNSIFPSPQLPLPAPFSTSSRRVSGALPSAHPAFRSTELDNLEIPSGSITFAHPETSRVNLSLEPSTYDMLADNRSQSSIQSRHESSPVNRSPRASSEQTGSNNFRRPVSSPVSSTNRLNDFLRSSAARIVSYYRLPSPARMTGSPRAQSMRSHHPQTPYLAVYNDALPPHTQPQTPAQLPESRHQSRYHPAYTAPIPRGTETLGRNNNGLPRYRVPPTPSRRSRASPVGLQRAGFRGLYGGRENGDDEQSWVDGVRFSNAEIRLWGLRDAAGDGRTLGDTPEREDWRDGRH